MDDPYLRAFERDLDAPERVQRALLSRTLEGFGDTAYGARFRGAGGISPRRNASPPPSRWSATRTFAPGWSGSVPASPAC